MEASFIETEETLGAPAPIRVFSLEGLGLDTDAILDHMISASVLLEWDEYDVYMRQVQFLMEKFPEAHDLLVCLLENLYAGTATLFNAFDLINKLEDADKFAIEKIRPRRKRAVAHLRMSKGQDDWSIIRIEPETYKQNVGSGDVRSIARKFEEMDKMLVFNQNIRNYLKAIANLTCEVHPEPVTDLDITLHHMYAVGDIIQLGDNAPEGSHQDGVDYIVSAMVIARHDIIGGESIITNETEDEVYLKRTLMPGEGIFQADKGSPLWHNVSEIAHDPDTETLDGFRDILGMDISIIR